MLLEAVLIRIAAAAKAAALLFPVFFPGEQLPPALLFPVSNWISAQQHDNAHGWRRRPSSTATLTCYKTRRRYRRSL
jgi:hypothetical protein